MQVPRNYLEAYQLDEDNENNFWKEVVALEILKLDEYEVFEDLGDVKKGTKVPKGYQKIKLHLVFDVKHDGRRRAHMVADVHLTEPPTDESIYSGVVSLRGLKSVIFSCRTQ